MRNLKIAGIQISSTADVEKNLKKAEGLITLAAEEGARIVALPQLFNTSFFPSSIDEKNFSLAEGEDGRTVSFLKGLSSRLGVSIIGSIFEKEKDSYYNTAFCTGPTGEIIGKYRKVHVPAIPLWEERYYFRPGDLGFPVFETPFAKVGVLICWDVFFPEGFRTLALKGAEIVFSPTASAFLHSRKAWERAAAAAAHANGFFVFRVNRTGKEERQEFYGRSFLAGPDGEFVVKPCGASAGVVVAEVDLSEITRVRSEWVFLKDRRPEEYGALTEKGK